MTRPASRLRVEPHVRHACIASRVARPRELRAPMSSRAFCRKPSRFLLSSRADSLVFEPSACSGPLYLFWTPRLGNRIFLLLGLVEQISRVVPAWVSFEITTYLGLHSPMGPPVWHGYRYDSSDSTGSSKPDLSSVSFGYATDQFVLGVPSKHRRLDFVPTGAHVARVRERASYWVEAEVRARASWRATRSDRGEP
ncbi:hypothetical protein E5676_scaffold94G00370 [Cucumis melo var. makuwa]|uniref:Uncharacterized protein n=1 Tax=Cucumis melo var. makuwa TaxID=1194695 RepID=A0A5D3D0E7_CUCMM|nr:hypothetical protein E6C27_scaffold163G00060 [Cucumis melo var. makuwa]TYK15929.1 hypothetical protein E5676_scaffold94G00370 [Cucumis melo var. makuwa]